MPRPITIEDLYGIKFLSRPRISPGGQQVAYVVTEVDARKHAYRSSIWAVPSSGGEARRLTAGPANATNPVWSPDGKHLAFLSEREGEASRATGADQKKLGKDKPQIWLLPTDGGEARQLTFLPHGASTPVWSPDGQWLAFAAPVGPLAEEGEDGKPLPRVRVIDRLFYRLDGAGFIYEHRSHLFLLNIAGGEAVQLTDGDWDDGDIAWSPDGKHLAFTSSRAEDRWQIPTPDIYTLAIEQGQAGELRCLTDGTLGCGALSWSPDGQTIVFQGGLKVRSGGHVDLYTIPSNASQGAATCLTHEFEGSFQDWTNTDADARDEHLSPAPVWSPDGKTIFALAAHRGATRVFLISADGNNTHPATLTAGDVHVRDFSINQTGERVAMLIGNLSQPPEVFIGTTATGGELQQLTSLNEELFSQLKLALPEHLPYTGAEGWPMDGWILKPPDFDPAQKYPMILQIHGGPHTQYGYGFFHEMQVQAANGYVVLFTNPRGSAGYGRDFSLAVSGAWGDVDSLDIMAGVDALIARGYIDESRLGVTGGSYGGFMTNWLIGHHPDRFKVAVTDRCVTNLASMFGSSDVGWMFDDEFDAVPWENLERLVQHSPITFVKNIRTPLLIIHSEQDLRCNIEQAEQLFTALKYMGREVLFVRFEGQSHGLSRGGHPRQRLERLRHGLNWFAKHMG
ncbi:MAG TPA: S9 family peptidase [Ktedonobacteraceae bacterium]|nr:S9 family peptidase [Ktedonobacteraceae bacterium]